MWVFFVNHFRQKSAKHITVENSSLVSNKSHALATVPLNNMATGEDRPNFLGKKERNVTLRGVTFFILNKFSFFSRVEYRILEK